MTTTVTVEAHCSKHLEVEIVTRYPTGSILDDAIVIQNDQTHVCHVHNDQFIIIRERVKSG
jgi:hypothetical protein